MNFDHIFEDLEAQFESGRASSPSPARLSGCISLRVTPVIGSPEELFAPIIGSDFVGGLSANFTAWNLFPNSQVVELMPQYSGDLELPRLKEVDRDIKDLISGFAKPTEMVWHSRNDFGAPRRGMLVGFECGFLIIETPRGIVAITAKSVTKFSLGIVDNLSEAFES